MMDIVLKSKKSQTEMGTVQPDPHISLYVTCLRENDFGTVANTQSCHTFSQKA